MTSYSALTALLLVVGCAVAASAGTEYRVGDEKGWTTGVDYTAWANGKTFFADDRLLFSYTPKEHTVTEVSKSDYDACSVSSSTPISNSQSGSTSLPLRPGAHYYICTIGIHCANGMKLAVTVSNSSSGTPGTRPTTVPYSYPPPAGSSVGHLQAAAPPPASSSSSFSSRLQIHVVERPGMRTFCPGWSQRMILVRIPDGWLERLFRSIGC
uniref:Phytocyanin domain-containing protein n=1 Tax=Oryza punctata TaxID=4537 RepID=A0A0E0LW23_ORYPU